MRIRPKPRPTSTGADQGWAALSTLISGFVVFGGIGWLLDEWWSTRLMTPIGLIVGMSLGIYAVVMQFGRPEMADETANSARTVDAGRALREAKALNRARRARAVQAQHAHSSIEGPPPANTRRETECP
jgi:ATP synthase protein I